MGRAGGGSGVDFLHVPGLLSRLGNHADERFRENVFSHAARSAPRNVVTQKLLRQFVPFVVGEPHREWHPAANELDVIPESAYVGSAALSLAVFGFWRSRWRGKWLAAA